MKERKYKEYGIRFDRYFDESDFEKSAKRYIDASKRESLLCIIDSVSKSGMSRTLKFIEAKPNKGKMNFLNFYGLFNAMGFCKVKDSDSFRVYGCGMDMVFHTHYTIIRTLKGLGFITKTTADSLAQVRISTF